MQSTTPKKSFSSKLAVAAAVGALAIFPLTALAQQHTGGKGGGGHDSGSGTSHTTGDDGHSSHDGGSSGKGSKKGGQEAGRGKGGGHSSLRDVFRDMEDEAAAEAAEKGKKGPPEGKGPSQTKGSSADKGKGSDQAKKGQKPASAVSEEEDSDKPAWAGKDATEPKPGSRSTDSGTKKGDIYGDLYVVLRNPDGTPVLVDGLVQVYYLVGTTLTCCIPYVDGELSADYTPVEVELGRLSVGRSPDRVLAAQLDEASKSLLEAASITTDAAGRIVLTAADGTTNTIDSPLENLALYKELLTTGTIYIEKADGTALDLTAIGINTSSDLTKDELLAAASFFAAASDKTVPITIDSIIYMNTILGITDVNYTTLTDYSRETLYSITDTALQPVVLQDPENDGTWVATSINPYVTIFNSTAPSDLTTTKDEDTVLTFAEAFTVAADDARTVIDFLHTYPVPDTN